MLPGLMRGKVLCDEGWLHCSMNIAELGVLAKAATLHLGHARRLAGCC
jgi:hypothetical protein